MPSLHHNPEASALQLRMQAIYCLYAGMARPSIDADMDAENGLGGRLLFAGEPEAEGALLRAANIAGAASLAASADAPALRRAMREGALDFVVTDLDEALRILKNEIRKKRPVAVGVSLAPAAIARQMLERGVQPDLLPAALARVAEFENFLALGARTVEAQTIPEGSQFHFIALPPDGAQRAAALDEALLGCFAENDALNRRWVRLAPIYLQAEARRLRMVVCDASVAQRLAASVGEKS